MALPLSSGFLGVANPLADSLDRVPGSFHRLGDGGADDRDRLVANQTRGLDGLLGYRLDGIRDLIRRSGGGVAKGCNALPISSAAGRKAFAIRSIAGCTSFDARSNAATLAPMAFPAAVRACDTRRSISPRREPHTAQ